MGCIISAGTNFQPFLLILFTLCFIIATKCVYNINFQPFVLIHFLFCSIIVAKCMYKFLEVSPSLSEVTNVLVGNESHNLRRYGFSTVSLNYFFHFVLL